MENTRLPGAGAMTTGAGASAAAGWTRAAALGLAFRPATEADVPFLFRVYASTRIEELAATPWSDEQRAQFLSMQVYAQHTDYRRNYAGANAGGSQPHVNMQPYLVLKFIIALQGVFPSRN